MPEDARGDSPKSILLFSDGTGNSSGKLFKTNVWRAYEAADLGPPAPGRRKQIAFYDNGVGTSAFRPLAVLGGVFGFGLKRNVLELYRFACRNYRPGDHLYAFGFSRGAFTIRLVIALIASQGLVPAESEAALLRRSADAWRAYRRGYLPRHLQWPTKLLRGARDALIRLTRRREDRYAPERNRHPEIRFVGVWDTVAAYGGPIVEITRAIDNWFFALSMPNYRLNPRVGVARHALALDDERDAFQPLVWDEVHERELVDAGTVAPDRLRQFWFTGMHADVGGGYPDESLSYISLLWMLEEAQKAGLRTLDVITDRHRALANSSGPIHDSRAGLGSYYRYQPRRIDALLNPPNPDTRSLWEPERDTERGLLTAARLHESVVARIAAGSDRYAPITIPATFEIHPPQRAGENAPQPASGDAAPAATGEAVPILSAADRAALLDPARAMVRVTMMERVWDWVWWRRVVYFATLGCTALLLSMPLWPATRRMETLCADSRCILPGLFSPLKAVLPALAAPWLDRYAAQPLVAATLVALLVVLVLVGRRCERALRARSAAGWAMVLGRDDALPDRAGGVARAIRRSGAYIGAMRFLKWRALPFAAALLAVAVLLALPGAVATQVWLARAERDGTLCRDPGATPAAAPGTPVAMSLATPCTDLRQTAAAGRRYVVTVEMTRQWCDATLPADPATGVTGGALRLAAWRFHRRVTGANWLKPLIVLRRPDAEDGRTPGAKVRIDVLDLHPVGPATYRGTFTAPDHGGRLYLAVNDVALPGWPAHFYANNRGAARVRVTQADAATACDDGCVAPPQPPRHAACGATLAP
ncbi:MAG: hypothetical protein DI544_01485 [Sphingomonas taxi]|uniref:T6SS Phospholipase effector Tle1-like catalytic domain-containing protein n=1 Tax=Sphingomonas taxi TaxID=1549858 RepID=A0A2W5PAU5_9SPHN|nr:MAG: hypothetical protein DI544_01485 [Sphingomonas taxi]